MQLDIFGVGYDGFGLIDLEAIRQEKQRVIGAQIAYVYFDRGKVGTYYTRPMLSGRPAVSADVIDAMVLAARDGAIDHAYKVSEMPRLAEFAGLGAQSNDAALSAKFHLVGGRVAVRGHARASLTTKCQRCLRPVCVEIDDVFHIVLANSEEEVEQLSTDQEAVIANATHLDLVWLLEEQLLLAMPLVPTHASMEECHESSGDVSFDKADAVEDVDNDEELDQEPVQSVEQMKTHRPFADLKDLMNVRGGAKKK